MNPRHHRGSSPHLTSPRPMITAALPLLLLVSRLDQGQPDTILSISDKIHACRSPLWHHRGSSPNLASARHQAPTSGEQEESGLIMVVIVRLSGHPLPVTLCPLAPAAGTCECHDPMITAALPLLLVTRLDQGQPDTILSISDKIRAWQSPLCHHRGSSPNLARPRHQPPTSGEQIGTILSVIKCN